VPTVKGKKYPYTKKGMMDAKKAINEDDARGFRARVAKAKRIKGETVAPEKARRAKFKGKVRKPGLGEGEPPNKTRTMRRRGKGEPPNRKYPVGPGNAKNKDYPGLLRPGGKRKKK